MNVHHIIVNQFLDYARSCMPAKYQKRFHGDLSRWISNMPDKDREDFAMRLMQSRKNKYTEWRALVDDIAAHVVKKVEVQRG